MKRKIKYYLLGIVLATLMSLTVIQVIIFYHFYQTQACRNMKEEVQAFHELFEDRDTLINDLSKVNTGRFTLIDAEGKVLFDSKADVMEMDNHGRHAETSFEMVNLCEIAKKVIGLLDFQARKNRIKLQIFGENTYIHANRNMMEELIYNLCDNAIRYNKVGGSVTVMITESQGQVLLTVKDTGIGIPDESRERIFERFYRVDKSRSKATGGTGLGLAIVKHIVLFHHAQIEVESEIGHGTAMHVMFTSCKEKNDRI